jgi:2-polyprenyl-3-methyl-5-hydroxy-6-metoxy-1,4-benzoquinol methylase
MPINSPLDQRKDHERAHGKLLAPNAVEIWGWGTPAGLERAQRRTELLIERAFIKPGMKVLEFGCGTGMFSRRLAEAGAILTAIDLSPDLIAEAQKEPNPNITYQIGDIEALPFSDAAFDAVIGSSVLHHVQVEKALKNAFRVLKPGSMIAFAEPNMLNPQIAVQKNIPYIKRKMGDSPDETAFFRWPMARLLKNLGFIDIVVDPYDFLHPAVPRKFIPVAKKLTYILESIPLIREIAGSIIISARKPA